MTILLATPSFLLKMAPVRYRSADGCGAKIIGLNTGVEHKIVEGKSYYAFAKNPNGTYKTTESDVTTFGVMATFVTSADVADQMVDELTGAVMENIGDFQMLEPAFRILDPKQMMLNGLSAPLHVGALKYYKDKGRDVA